MSDDLKSSSRLTGFLDAITLMVDIFPPASPPPTSFEPDYAAGVQWEQDVSSLALWTGAQLEELPDCPVMRLSLSTGGGPLRTGDNTGYVNNYARGLWKGWQESQIVMQGSFLSVPPFNLAERDEAHVAGLATFDEGFVIVAAWRDQAATVGPPWEQLLVP